MVKLANKEYQEKEKYFSKILDFIFDQKNDRQEIINTILYYSQDEIIARDFEMYLMAILSDCDLLVKYCNQYPNDKETIKKAYKEIYTR